MFSFEVRYEKATVFKRSATGNKYRLLKACDLIVLRALIVLIVRQNTRIVARIQNEVFCTGYSRL